LSEVRGQSEVELKRLHNLRRILSEDAVLLQRLAQ
jgi:hypothetical protein